MTSTSTSTSVIVFGPTGAVGRAVALEAKKRGAKVWLAMRDINKPIDDIPFDNHKFPRIKADLSDPDSIKEAIKQSNVKAVFFYNVPGVHEAIPAMKQAGIEYVVYLSSWTLMPGMDLRQVSPDDLAPSMHSQVENALEDAGIAHTSLRPGGFASNFVGLYLERSSTPSEARFLNPDAVMDCIVPGDIGRVGGSVLVNRPTSTNKQIIYLPGPQLLSLRDQYDIFRRITGEDIILVVQDLETYRQSLEEKGMPLVFVDYLIKTTEFAETDVKYPPEMYKDNVGNVKKYSGYESTTFEEYVKANHSS